MLEESRDDIFVNSKNLFVILIEAGNKGPGGGEELKRSIQLGMGSCLKRRGG